jgi:hypothetical protein
VLRSDVRSHDQVPAPLKIFGLAAAAILAGVYFGSSTASQIDPFYYRPVAPRSSYTSNGWVGADATPRPVYAATPYAIPAYPYAPAPSIAVGIELEADSIADAARDLEDSSDLGVVYPPEVASQQDDSCHDCGGPTIDDISEPDSSAEPAGDAVPIQPEGEI